MLDKELVLKEKEWHENLRILKFERDRTSNKYHSRIDAQRRKDWKWLNENRVELFKQYAVGTTHSIWFFNERVVGMFSWHDLAKTNLEYFDDNFPYAQRINTAQLLRRKEDPVIREKKFFKNSNGEQICEWVNSGDIIEKIGRSVSNIG